MKLIRKYRFGNNPDAAFEAGGVLYGIEYDGIGADDYDSERAKALYAAIGANEADPELVLGQIGTTWALVGCTVADHPFAVERCHPKGRRKKEKRS